MKRAARQVHYEYTTRISFVAEPFFVMLEPTSPTEYAAAEPPCGDELDAPLAALLARGAQDTGVATETVRLDALTESEKRVLLALLQARMGTPPQTGERDAAAFLPKGENTQ